MTRGQRRALGWGLVLLGLCSAAASADTSMDWEQSRRFSNQTKPVDWTVGMVQRFIAGWPEIPRIEADKLMEKYGVPDEVSANRLAWNGRGRWERIALHRGEDFTRRSGVLEQSVRYEVPVGHWRDLNALAIGIAFVPEDDELVASSESEEINTLALNVAADVLEGRRSVDGAREFYRKTLDLALSGKSSRYTRGLLFASSRPRTKGRPTWLQPLMP